MNKKNAKKIITITDTTYNIQLQKEICMWILGFKGLN